MQLAGAESVVLAEGQLHVDRAEATVGDCPVEVTFLHSRSDDEMFDGVQLTPSLTSLPSATKLAQWSSTDHSLPEPS